MQRAGALRLAPPSQGASRPAPRRALLLLGSATSLRLGACGSAPTLRALIRALEGKLSPNYRHARIQDWPQAPQRSQGSWLCRLLSDLWDPNSLNTSMRCSLSLGLSFPENMTRRQQQVCWEFAPTPAPRVPGPVLPFRAWCSGRGGGWGGGWVSCAKLRTLHFSHQREAGSPVGVLGDPRL